MKLQDYYIIPYSEEYHEKACQLEHGIVQGNNIQLEIIKKNFLDRARVFKKYYCCFALNNEHNLVGSAIGAQTTIVINGKQSVAGIVFDTKVHPSFRSKGIGRMLAKDVYKQFFQPHGLSKIFITAKLSNLPVVKLSSRTVPNTWFYDFVYLTIPTNIRIKIAAAVGEIAQQFSVQLFNHEDFSGENYTRLDNGLGYFHTYKMYRLKIKKISWLYKKGIEFLKTMQPSKYTSLPCENDIISFTTLYNHTPQNIDGINEVLKNLELNGIKQLMVCCRRNDHIYNKLKKNSINQYSYHVVSDFYLNKNDEIAIDVRCL
ncbi:MAG: GNAT family N-acetyltransferase [Chitinophagaceae bacterium]